VTPTRSTWPATCHTTGAGRPPRPSSPALARATASLPVGVHVGGEQHHLTNGVRHQQDDAVRHAQEPEKGPNIAQQLHRGRVLLPLVDRNAQGQFLGQALDALPRQIDDSSDAWMARESEQKAAHNSPPLELLRRAQALAYRRIDLPSHTKQGPLLHRGGIHRVAATAIA